MKKNLMLNTVLKIAPDGDESGRFSGYASTYNNPDLAGDVMLPGCYDAVLDRIHSGGQMPVMFFAHDHYSIPCGVWDEITSDEKGLHVSGRINRDLESGKEIYSALKFGSMSGLSVGISYSMKGVEENASGGFDFNGGGFPLAEKAMEGEAVTYAFLLKILFTTVCISCGFKGGEIVPTLCIGACVGSLFAGSVGADTRVYAAAGMAAMFAGMTNSPISSLLLAFELFGYAGMPYFAIAIAVCFTLSGYYGLYSSQRFAYSKTRTVFIDRKGPRRLWDDNDTDSLRN